MGRKQERDFQASLRAKVGMPESPESNIATAWEALEKTVGAVQDGLEALLQSEDPEVRLAVGDALTGLAENMTAAVAALEAVEDELVDAGLVQDDDLLEPSQEADA